MSPSAVGSGHRLILRIYLVSVGVIVLFAFSVGMLSNLLIGDPWQDFHAPKLQYAARVFGSHWDSDELLLEELRRMKEVGRYDAAAYEWSGRLRATTFPNGTPTLAEEHRAEVAQGKVLRLSMACFPAFCPVATGVQANGKSVGYVVFQSSAEIPTRAYVPFVLVLGGLLFAAILLAKTMLVPLERLVVTARAFGSGDLSARTGVKRTDELGQVARAFDEMANRLTTVLQSQTVLLANVAHELRTPLARIRLALDLAAGEDLETAKRSMAEIATDLEELERLVSDTLTSARMDLAKGRAPSGAPPLALERVSVREWVQSACARARARDPERPLAIGPGDGCDAVIRGDPALLRRVLENLLDNARKYSDPGRPISVRCDLRGDEVEVIVKDEGIGISKEDLAHLTEPFFRADPSRGRKTGGVGLGLSLSAKIAEAHGGSLTFDSEPGRGTVAHLRLPRDVSASAPDEAAAPDRSAAALT